MRIILTHEQADFDALASLLGAHLLDDSAVPVLPRRMNRNVRAFLTLYGVDLPFLDPRDLSGEPIEQITLVDTQSMVSLKGMSANTRVQVIDHHPLRDNLPPDWTVEVAEIGATTTLLVEALREHNGPLTTIQATLFLLGIYEDTGQLTYTRTTARDLRAAAYLIEQGASLQIAGNFLNHPLSDAQQALYDSLRAHAAHFHIHGHTVVVACGDAQGMDEELSSIVHKLRDLLDPDALFVLVNTRGGVQLIARSTSDNIDVAAILSNFGGGGHERAAACLIRGRDLDNVRTELLRLLPEHVRPAITVAQIMSRGAQVLPADTPVEEAARRMRLYGYEGYPVVALDSRRYARGRSAVLSRAVTASPQEAAGQGNASPASLQPRVIGLLTRRAVDRALAHKLHSTAASLMEAGEVYVYPGDSIEHLQRVMTDTGWGQVPVVDPENGKILGIVTRTDLLKTLTPQARLPSRQNLAARLEATLPPARLALLKIIAEQAHQQHCALYIVGGFVRDLLLDRPSPDVDLVVEGDAIALARSLARQHGGRVTSHARFGTAKWHLRGANSGTPALIDEGSAIFLDSPDLPDSVDLVTARTEFYTHPTALPTVERGSIKLDLHRRDFTFNTLALRLDGHHYGELHDYWGGLNDLRHGLVRVLHSLSFVDDPTRILRAVRFEQRFDFRIEDRTLELLLEATSLLDRLSGDRIRHELNHMLVEEKAPRILARLNELGLLQAIHPDLTWDNWLQSRLEALPAKQPDKDWELGEGNEAAIVRELSYTLWLLRLPESKCRAVAGRLKLPADLTEVILAASRLWDDLPSLVEASPSHTVARLEDVPPLARYAVYLATSDIHLRRKLQQYATRWRKVFPTVNGNDLLALGLRPGPDYRRILSGLRNAWLDGQINTPEEEAALLEELIRQ